MVEMAATALADRRILTFDVVGTLIDFEAGILACLRESVGRAGREPSDLTLLDAFARAEDAQQHASPQMPFTQMLHPIYEQIASELGLPREHGEADQPAASIPEWPAFPDAIDGLAKLGARYRLVALTNADNWALEHMSRTLGDPFDDRVTAEDVGANKPDPQVFAYCRGRQSVHGYALASTSRRASTTTSARPSASASRSAGSSAGGASRARARRPRRRPSPSPTTTSRASPSSSRRSKRSAEASPRRSDSGGCHRPCTTAPVLVPEHPPPAAGPSPARPPVERGARMPARRRVRTDRRRRSHPRPPSGAPRRRRRAGRGRRRGRARACPCARRRRRRGRRWRSRSATAPRDPGP